MAEHDEDLPSLLAIYLLDLRAQYEAELRELTHAQRILEDYRRSRGSEEKRQSAEGIRQRLRVLGESNRAIADSVVEAQRQAATLEPEEEDVTKRS